MGKEVPEQMNVGDRITEALGDHFGRQTLHKGGTQSLIAALPVVHGMEEELFIEHASLIAYDGLNVNIKILKIDISHIQCHTLTGRYTSHSIEFKWYFSFQSRSFGLASYACNEFNVVENIYLTVINYKISGAFPSFKSK